MIFEIFRNFGKYRFGPIKVQGSSMAPAFTSGDWLMACWFSKPIGQPLLKKLIGKPVLVRRGSHLENDLDILQLKRLVRIEKSVTGQFEHQYWVEGDNRQASTDSRTWGYLVQAEIKAVIIFRYHKAKRA